MKRVRFYLRHPVDLERIDVVEVEAGAVLADTQSSKKYTPLVSVSALVRVEFTDDDATTVDHETSAIVASTPDPQSENVLRTLHIEPVSVPTHVEPDDAA